ncbi:MAG: Outer membrane efflux protein [Pelotomaculum sp. PtaB.Bin104]|nr:MAG: Outer membrane efflux protein [Pelotomaculum sp. PtaB.Bin104]
MRRITLLLVALLFVFFNATFAWGEEPAAPELTLNQAVEKAKSNSINLQSLKYDVERSYEVRQFDADKVTYIPFGPTSNAVSRAYSTLVQQDLNYQISKRNLVYQQDVVEMQVYKLYDELLQAQEKVKVCEAQLKSADWQRIVANANYRVGMLNMMGLIQAQATAESAKTGLEAAKKALDDTYQKFNQLVGLDPSDRPVLVDKPKFEELKIGDLDSEVSRTLAVCPTVWVAQQKVDLAKITLDLYDFSSSSRTEPYKAKEIDVTKAELSVSDTTEQMEKLVRTLYYSLKQYEEQYKSAQENVKSAEEALRVARVKYDVGMATRPDVLAAESTLAQANQSLLNYSCQHEILVFAFKKPWAYAAS